MAPSTLMGRARDWLRPAARRIYRLRDSTPGRISYGLDRLDRELEKWLDIDGGVFIEAGANDGVSFSNTLYFERHRGWTGLLIEPIPELAERCVKNRSPDARVALCALGGPAEAGSIVPLTYCNLMSIVRGAIGSPAEDEDYVRLGKQAQNVATAYEVHAAVVTLSALIDRYRLDRVDLLVLDVEGYERQALAGLDMQRHKPRFILVEALFHEAAIREMLAPHYAFVAELGCKDLLFRAKA